MKTWAGVAVSTSTNPFLLQATYRKKEEKIIVMTMCHTTMYNQLLISRAGSI